MTTREDRERDIYVACGAKVLPTSLYANCVRTKNNQIQYNLGLALSI